MKTIVPPAKSPGRMSGRVTFRNVRQRDAPRFREASSMVGSTLARAAEAFRNMIGYRCSTSRMTTPRKPAPSQSTFASPRAWRMRLTEPASSASSLRMAIAPTNGGRIMGSMSMAEAIRLPRKS